MKAINIPELKESFQRDGYVFIPGFLTEKEVNEVNMRLDRFIGEKVPVMTPEHVFYEDKADTGTLKQLQDMNEYDPFLVAC